MTKRTRRYRKRGGGEVPPLQTYGYENGASSPQQNAMLKQQQAAQEQNALNKQHAGGKRRRTRRRSRRRLRGGYQYKQLGGRIVVPQSDNAPPSAGPVDGNSLAVGGAENLTQNNENAKYDNINAPAKVTTVAGGARKKKRRKTRKHRKTRGKYGYNQRGCSRNGKKKSRRRSKRRNSKRFITGGKRRRSKGKGGYAAQLWGCFS